MKKAHIALLIGMAISVTYEFIEWWTALVARTASMEFLGTQSDVWDTQEDMFMRKWQDRQLARLR